MSDQSDAGWVRPSAVQAGPPPADPAPRPTGDAPGSAAPRTRRRGAAGTAGTAAPTTRRRGAAPARPSWADEPTEPVPAVPVGGGGPGSGGGPRRGGGGGGGGRGRGGGGSGAAPTSAGRTLAVMLVVGVLALPFIGAAAYFVLHFSPSSPTVKKSAPAGPQAGEYKLFLRPGLTLSQIGDVAATLPGHTKAAFLATANSGSIRSRYQPSSTNSLEGLLYPDTYFVGATETDASVLRRLVNRFDQVGDALALSNLPGTQPYQTVIIASLVQQEAKLPSDGPLVAAVIYNRLKLKMPLQIDATLCYSKGGCPPVPTNADKKLNSPYNTYKVPGLPPTPIASVTQASLQAALSPPNVPFLYYVISDSTGKLAFATTLAQQQANIAAAHRKGLL